MNREIVGMVLGGVVVTVVAWFVALSLMMYSLGSINPLDWSTPQRVIHLGLQLVLIIAYWTFLQYRNAK